jgi:hypothetical protein
LETIMTRYALLSGAAVALAIGLAAPAALALDTDLQDGMFQLNRGYDPRGPGYDGGGAPIYGGAPVYGSPRPNGWAAEDDWRRYRRSGYVGRYDRGVEPCWKTERVGRNTCAY